MRRYRWVGVVVMLGVLAACHSSSPAKVKTVNGSPPKFAVVLDDHGLTFSPRRIAAGRYVVSFTDRRSQRPAGQKIELQFGPSGPLIPVLTVPLGGHVTGILLQNEIPWLVTNGVRKYVPGEESPTIVTSPQFPTPAT